MRRIFTFSFIAISLSLASFSSFGQCAFSTTAPAGAPGGGSFDFTSSAQGFTGTNVSWSSQAGNGFLLTGNTASTTITTPALRATGQTNVISRFTLERTGSNSITAYSVTYTTTSGTTTTICSGTLSISPNFPVVYYLTTPTNVAIQGGTSFLINITFTQSGGMRFDDFGTTATPTNAALPVKFQSLEATPSNNAVSLKWMVATEENLSGYAIEKSFDARNFSKVGFVNAVNQSTYTFTDAKAAGTVYYRIKSVDVDGKFAFSTIVLVKAGQSLIVLNAYPSPFVNSFNLDHGTATAGSLITISAEDGRTIKTLIPAVGTQRTSVDLSTAKAGLYLVRYKNSNGEVETLKILKQQ